METRNQLLVSVRNVAEAAAALAGGARLIDVKEPANGPLGRANPAVFDAVIRSVAGRAPVSAACGELEPDAPSLPPGLQFAKFGLAGWHGRDWQSAWMRVELPAGCRPVAVAYADRANCGAPPISDIVEFAIKSRFGAFLIDTFRKDGRSLLDHVPIGQLSRWVSRCQSAQVPVALAGSLDLAAIDRLRSLRPDWFAVRGAVCEAGRDSAVCEKKVREIARFLDPKPVRYSGRASFD